MTEVEFSRDFLDSLGILDWGYTEESNPQSFKHYDEWVNKNHHGDLKYLSDHRKNLRSDLKLVYPQFQSALVFYSHIGLQKNGCLKIIITKLLRTH